MRKLQFTSLLAGACLALASCGGTADEADNRAAAPATDSAADGAAAETRTASAAFPRGARIVEEDGVTFRIDPDGTRIRLGDADSRILVEEDVRYRVDPDGTRVRIGPDGGELEVDVPDVEINTSR